MGYSTETDIINLEMTEAELAALTDDVNKTVVDPVKVDAAIERADAEIDGYCMGRYTVPFNPVPDQIKSISVILAAYSLHQRRREDVDDTLFDKMIKALKTLKRISEGSYSLEGATLKETSGIASTTDPDAAHTFRRGERDEHGNVIKKGNMDVW